MPTLPEIELVLQMQRALQDGYRPHLQVGEGEYLGVRLFGVRAGETGSETHRAYAQLVYWPDVDYASLDVGVQFKVKEGARTVGEGTVIRGWKTGAV